jgi:hypothetical protein
MMVRRLLLFFVPVIFVFILLFGCNNEKICNEYTYSALRLHFYTVYKKGERIYTEDSVLTSIKFISDLFIDTTVKASKITIPLSPHTDSSAFVVKINSLPSDVVYLKYKRNRVFINYECGFRTDFTIDTLVSMEKRFDSIQIVHPVVTANDTTVNIKIFYNRKTNSE